MHDVHAGIVFARQSCQQCDRLHFGGRGARCHIRRVVARAGGRRRCCQRSGPLGVRHEQRAARGQHRHRARQVGFVARGKLVHTRGNEEALEAQDTGVVQLGQFAGISWDHAPRKPTSTLQRPWAAARLASSAATSTVAGILFKGMSSSAVTPPAAARAGRGLETLPFSAAGFVHVHVAVHDTRGHQERTHVGDRDARRRGVVRMQRDDALTSDLDRRGSEAARQQHAARSE
jgi:hypothetical protein